MEIDHIFLRAQYGAPEAGLLLKFGLTEGSGNQHAGQGTENRRFFFRNAFIELLWISDEAEIKAEATRPTMLYERLNSNSAVSPFGICFRSAPKQESTPFPTWDYRPKYLPEGMTVEIGTGVDLAEPMWFFLKEGSPPGSAPAARRQPLEHAAGFLEITFIAITTLGAKKWSPPALAAIGTGCVSIVEADHHLMEVTFDYGRSGHRHDFRPALPLVFNY